MGEGGHICRLCAVIFCGRELDVSYNQLSVLPESFGSLTQLRSRDVVMSVVLFCFSVMHVVTYPFAVLY